MASSLILNRLPVPPQSFPTHLCFRATCKGTVRLSRLHSSRARSSNDSGSKANDAISEDVLQRLRLAEEEAKKLREELAKAKAEALERVCHVSMTHTVGP